MMIGLKEDEPQKTFSLWVTQIPCEDSLIQALSKKHFLIYLGSDRFLLYAKQQKKGDMRFHRFCKGCKYVSVGSKWDKKMGKIDKLPLPCGG